MTYERTYDVEFTEKNVNEEHHDTSGWFDEKDPKKCPFDHTRVCPHQLFKSDPLWCQVCVLVELVNGLERLRATQS